MKTQKTRSAFSFLYGKNGVQEALKAKKRRIVKIFLLDSPEAEFHQEEYKISHNGDKKSLVAFLKNNNISYQFVAKNKLTELCGSPFHQGIVMQAGPFIYSTFNDFFASAINSSPSSKAFFLICDQIQDPQNLGALCRSAYAFGVNAIILSQHHSVEVTPTVCKASAGASEHLSIIKVINISQTIQQLKKNQFWIYGADQNAKMRLSQIKPSAKMALVLGSEQKGLRPLVKDQCDQLFAIPFTGPFDSLNVASAGAIALYHFLQDH